MSINTELDQSEALVILFQDGASGDTIIFNQDTNEFFINSNGNHQQIVGPLTEMLEMAVQHWDDFMEVMVAVHKKLQETKA